MQQINIQRLPGYLNGLGTLHRLQIAALLSQLASRAPPICCGVPPSTASRTLPLYPIKRCGPGPSVAPCAAHPPASIVPGNIETATKCFFPPFAPDHSDVIKLHVVLHAAGTRLSVPYSSDKVRSCSGLQVVSMIITRSVV